MRKPKNILKELLISLQSSNNTDSDETKNLKKLCIDLIKDTFPSIPDISFNKKDDGAEFIIKKEKYYIVSIDELLTVYYSKTTCKFVGGLIKGISKYLQKLDKQNMKGFTIQIDDGNCVIGHVFTKDNLNYKPEELQKHLYKI